MDYTNTIKIERGYLDQVYDWIAYGGPLLEPTDLIETIASVEFADGHVIDIMAKQGIGSTGYIDVRGYGDHGNYEIGNFGGNCLETSYEFEDQGNTYTINIKES